MKELRTISSVVKYSNPYWDYKLDKYELPNGKTGRYHYASSPGSTIVVPKKDDETFILIKQYRYLNKRFSIEFPGGGLKPGLTAEENASEELAEETGFSPGELKLMGSFNPCNGITDEISSIFLASSLKPCGKKGDESEEIEIVELKYNDIIQKIKSGELWDGMTLAAWSLYYFSYMPEGRK
jgi:ADP-ribose pyrophosphatase